MPRNKDEAVKSVGNAGLETDDQSIRIKEVYVLPLHTTSSQAAREEDCDLDWLYERARHQTPN